MGKVNQLAQDELEAEAKRLEARVLLRARRLRLVRVGLSWPLALEQAAYALCKNWDWRVAEYIGPGPEPAHFFLTHYNGGYDER